jgi:hypothetical protein
MKKEVYEKATSPSHLASPRLLSANQKRAAKAFAKKSGTAYPSLLANMAGARAKK